MLIHGKDDGLTDERLSNADTRKPAVIYVDILGLPGPGKARGPKGGPRVALLDRYEYADLRAEFQQWLSLTTTSMLCNGKCQGIKEKYCACQIDVGTRRRGR